MFEKKNTVFYLVYLLLMNFFPIEDEYF